eukprot:9430511-Lingulodinium_polyedra.AAC.1
MLLLRLRARWPENAGQRVLLLLHGVGLERGCAHPGVHGRAPGGLSLPCLAALAAELLEAALVQLPLQRAELLEDPLRHAAVLHLLRPCQGQADRTPSVHPRGRGPAAQEQAVNAHEGVHQGTRLEEQAVGLEHLAKLRPHEIWPMLDKELANMRDDGRP